jgi:AcrR family transcriptional regulator
MTSVASVTPQERILQAATYLFSEVGFRGTSTRDIARMAAVNDATVYRHFSSKKDLFAAVLETELRKLSVRADLLMHVTKAEDFQSALLRIIFELLIEALVGQPRRLRLLQFSVLEFGDTMQPIYHKYLGGLLDGAAAYLGSSQERDPLLSGDPRAMVAAFATTVVGMQTLYPLFGGEQLSGLPTGDGAEECSQLWHAVLFGNQRVQ